MNDRLDKKEKLFKWLCLAIIVITIVGGIFVFTHFNFDYCVEDGICEEGYVMGDKVVNKEYCLKNNYKWIEEQKVCILH